VQLRNLQDMTIGQRIALTFIIVLVILFALALFGYLTGGWDVQAEPRAVDPYGELPLDAQLLPVDKRALEEAYRAHLIKLWTVWLTDGAKDATHFRNGLRIARGAYHIAADGIAKRERDLGQPK
jgi:hypothetical protein